MDQENYWDNMAEYGAEASVIDPNDLKGHKNRYIAQLRDKTILKKLNDLPKESKVLDFGCGSGNLSEVLTKHGYQVSGIDISKRLLDLAKKRQGKYTWDIFYYDGNQLPLETNSMDIIITYSVLNYLHEDKKLIETLKEFERVLKPNGQVIAIEQVKRKTTISRDKSKKQRKLEDFLEKFQKAGLSVNSHKIIRRGHFPLLYPIRYGLVPTFLYNKIMKFEALIGNIAKQPIYDYADVVFSLSKENTI